MTARLLVRADAGPSLGIGHVMRMLALAEAWLARGGRVTLAGQLPSSLAERARATGAEVLPLDAQPGSDADASATAVLVAQHNPSWVAADGYHFSRRWQQTVRDAGAKLLVVDDNAENQPYLADQVLNVNLHAAEELYRQRDATTQLMLGPRYALIRSEFRKPTGACGEVPRVAARWLVTMGGADPTDATGRLLWALTRSALANVEVTVLVGDANRRVDTYRRFAVESPVRVEVVTHATDIAGLMAKADLALCGCSGTVWELAVMGVPTAVLLLADNQRQLGDELARREAAALLGDARGDSDGTPWLAGLTALANDARKRSALRQNAAAVVDGLGASRVVETLLRGESR